MGLIALIPIWRSLACIETQSSSENLCFYFSFRFSKQVCHASEKQKPTTFVVGFLMRRVRDSNPWTPRRVNGFQDHRIRPLCQLSGGKNNIFYISFNVECEFIEKYLFALIICYLYNAIIDKMFNL